MANDARHGNGPPHGKGPRLWVEDLAVDHTLLRVYLLHHRLAVLLRRWVQPGSEHRDFLANRPSLWWDSGGRVGHDVDETGATKVNAAGGG